MSDREYDLTRIQKFTRVRVRMKELKSKRKELTLARLYTEENIFFNTADILAIIENYP